MSGERKDGVDDNEGEEGMAKKKCIRTWELEEMYKFLRDVLLFIGKQHASMGRKKVSVGG